MADGTSPGSSRPSSGVSNNGWIELRALGIQADIILFHPYDRWGFADMGEEADRLYLRYIVARLAAYSNVWWSLANEYNLMHSKPLEAWDRYFELVQQADPYDHLRSIHNWQRLDVHDWEMFYDHSRPWVTHCSDTARLSRSGRRMARAIWQARGRG